MILIKGIFSFKNFNLFSPDHVYAFEQACTNRQASKIKKILYINM